MAMLSPYPGLRPFNLEEHNLFFGREEQVDELLLRLQDTRFLAVVGPSGCGKSSLVRAGMMAALSVGVCALAVRCRRSAGMTLLPLAGIVPCQTAQGRDHVQTGSVPAQGRRHGCRRGRRGDGRPGPRRPPR